MKIHQLKLASMKMRRISKVITTALPEEALNELLALTAAPGVQERPGDVLVSPRMADDDDAAARLG